jgi:hypothetical protein
LPQKSSSFARSLLIFFLLSFSIVLFHLAKCVRPAAPSTLSVFNGSNITKEEKVMALYYSNLLHALPRNVAGGYTAKKMFGDQRFKKLV